MPAIHELATLTSKGQITLPKPIRQALGVDIGGKIVFDLHDDGNITVRRADHEHQDPAIGAFLNLLTQDIQAGKHIQSLPAELVQAMEKQALYKVCLDDNIDGDVDI